jgi:hypothetical protein
MLNIKVIEATDFIRATPEGKPTTLTAEARSGSFFLFLRPLYLPERSRGVPPGFFSRPPLKSKQHRR